MSLPLNAIVEADVMDYLPSLPGGCVQCCVTSPPYWGLRSYGTEPTVWPPALSTASGERAPSEWRL